MFCNVHVTFLNFVMCKLEMFKFMKYTDREMHLFILRNIVIVIQCNIKT